MTPTDVYSWALGRVVFAVPGLPSDGHGKHVPEPDADAVSDATSIAAAYLTLGYREWS